MRMTRAPPSSSSSSSRTTSMISWRIILLSLWFALGSAISALAAVDSSSSSNCERLKVTLTYTQEKAPRDLSSVLPVVVEKVNRVLDGVVDVEVEWSGAELHGRVGQHLVKSTVTRLASAVASDKSLEISLDEDGREVTTQCFHVPFTILDTNECTLPAGHAMKHKCPAPSICVNTIGSYECLCPQLPEHANTSNIGNGGGSGSINIPPGNTAKDEFWTELEASERSPWEVSLASNSQSSCPALASTHGCCSEAGHSVEGQKCRQRFHCPVDPCSSTSSNDCADNAMCVRADRPADNPNFSCQCPEGLMGNGRACQKGDPKPEPKVMFDGKTPTELTVKNNFYCGCTKPIVDACSGFPPCQDKHEICMVGAGNAPHCACKPGYVLHEKYGCVDQNPPKLKLRHDPHGDQTLRLKQGDEYREYMVDIVDDNAEDYLRSLKVSYSRPLPPGCLTEVGEFHVNYTIAMPWAKVPYVRVTRRVLIEDIDECHLDSTLLSKFQGSCPALVPQCDTAAGAKCINTHGSYQCQCPSQSSGDGFVKDAKFDGFPAPTAYKGGTSCVDTSKPTITLRGPNPKVFKICECGGLSGVMNKGGAGGGDGAEDNALQLGQRKMYEDDIKEMVRATAGAELCATASHTHPKPSDCVKAVDRTYKGDVDLSDKVVVGEPIQKSSLQWSVPYNVKDEAGNAAITVWRDVVVQEVDLASVENLIRAEVTREQEASQQQAIHKAVREERAKWDREQASNNPNRRSGSSSSSKTCPACPLCDCPNTPETTKESCTQYCEHVSKSCSLSDESIVYSLLFWLEDYLSPSLVPAIILVALGFLAFLVLRFVVTTLYNPRSYQDQSYSSSSSSSPYVSRLNDEMILRSPQPGEMRSPAPPPRQSLMSMGNIGNTNGNGNASFLSPSGSQQQQPGFGSPSFPPSNNNGGTPRSNHRPAEPMYDESIYMSPPLITPSKTGDGVRRRNL